MRHSIYGIVAATCFGAACVMTTGCNSDPVSAQALRSNATPALVTTARTKGQADNDHARIIDNETRSAWDDLDRLLLLDRNNRLTPYRLP